MAVFDLPRLPARPLDQSIKELMTNERNDQVFNLNKVHETLCQMIQFISRHDERSMYWFIDI